MRWWNIPPSGSAQKTLFATHYHELTELEGETEGVLNYNIAAKKRGDDIVFLRKILRGPSDESYGIEVAKLAGVPRRVITRARELLDSMPAREHIPAAPVKDGGCEGAISFQDNIRRLGCGKDKRGPT